MKLLKTRFLIGLEKAKPFQKRAQAAMEFLMTYGWAILVVAIAISALAYFGVLSPEQFLPEKCAIATGSGLFCDEFSATAGTGITLRIKNILTESVWVDSITLDGPACAYAIADTEISAGSTTDFSLSCSGNLTSGDRIKATITISYAAGATASEGLTKSATGELITLAP